jgi:hypothetical protein
MNGLSERVTELIGSSRWKAVALKPGNMKVPTGRKLKWPESSYLTEQVLRHWARKPLPNWESGGKVDAPRVILGKLALGRDVREVNDYLLKKEPWGEVGSTWPLHPKGDYDFTLTALTTLLYLYGKMPKLLYPATRKHLLRTLLTEDGGKEEEDIPMSLGLAKETENHILMIEGSRYLKNRWLNAHGSKAKKHDNEMNGMEKWLLKHLGEIKKAGFYEFNSIPYYGYTITAILNLEAFGSDKVRRAARTILDRMNWEYALGSLDLRRYPPFRRQLRRKQGPLDGDYHTPYMKVWLSLQGRKRLLTTRRQAHAVMAALLPYRPPDNIVDWTSEKQERYFVRIGHGPDSSPEIYSGGREYLLSAGGVHRGLSSRIVARPITLMLKDDRAKELKDVFHLAGPGDDWKDWNNTGVHKDLAVAAGPVHIPHGRKAKAKNRVWKTYNHGNLCICVHSRKKLGIIVLTYGKPEQVLDKLTRYNDDPGILRHKFRWPGGRGIGYDVNAPQDEWIITSVGDRDFDKWPRMDGDL